MKNQKIFNEANKAGNQHWLKKQAGVTLVEMMIVLMIIVGIIALGAGMFSSAIGRSDATQAISNMTNIISSSRSLRTGSGYPDSKSDFHSAMQRIDGYPSNMEVTDDSAINLWGGEVTVEAKSSAPRGFVIESVTIPESVCHELAAKVGTSRVIETDVNGAGKLPSDELDDAVKNCEENDKNSIEWTITG